MNRQDLNLLLRTLDYHNYAIGTTDLYTYVLSCNPQHKRRSRSRKRFVLNKISLMESISHCIFFDHCWEILHHLPCKTMVLYRTSEKGLNKQLTCLPLSEHVSSYLIH